MPAYNVTLYSNTGLSPSNCMESIVKLRSLFSGKDVNAVWTLQDKFLARIRVAAKYSDMETVDYCVVNGSKGYWVTGITMLNENVCELSLQTDYITTVGAQNIDVVSGTCRRRHVTSDELFANTIAEPFTPSQPLVLDYGEDIGFPPGDEVKVIIATVDLREIGETARVYEDETKQFSVTVPQLPPTISNTIFSISGSGYGGQYRYPIGSAYNGGSSLIQENISAIRSLGVESVIVDSYAIPEAYLQDSAREDLINALVGISKTVSSTLKPEYGTVKNKKCFMGAYNRYAIVSLCTGDTLDFEVENIINSSNNVQWILFADPMPDGQPMLKPAYYHKKQNDAFFATIRGATWQKAPVAFYRASGNLINETAYNRQTNLNNFRTAVGIGGQAFSTGNMAYQNAQGKKAFNKQWLDWDISDPSSMPTEMSYKGNSIGIASGIVNTVANTITAMADVRNNGIQFWTSQNIVAPEIQYMPVNGVQNYYGNKFYEMRYRLSSADLQRFDDFLSAYGYAVDEPLTNACFFGRQNHNFVLAENCDVKFTGGYGSLIEKQGVVAQLQAGVRIWHTVPSHSALLNNPIA